jgi:hypothetical protein
MKKAEMRRLCGFQVLMVRRMGRGGDRLACGPENWVDLGENWAVRMAGMRRFRGVWAIAHVFLELLMKGWRSALKRLRHVAKINTI